MAFWKIAPGRHGEFWVEQRERGCIAVGWNQTGDLKRYPEPRAQRIEERFNELRKKNVFDDSPKQLLTFFTQVRKNDGVVACSGGLIYGLGTVDGGYRFDKNLTYQHSLPVHWDITFWSPLTGEDLGLPRKLIAKLSHQRTIVSLDKHAWEVVHKAATKARTPFKNLRNWEGMLRAPETEQEAIVLFSKLSSVLGMKLEYMMRPFPDAGIMVKKGRNWVARTAEFELLASHFIKHGHPKTMKDKDRECDYIICWENDLKQRFRGIRIVELKGELLRLL